MRAVLKRITATMLCLVLLSASVIALIPESATEASAATYVTGDNPVSSSYKGSIYYENFTRVPLTGDARTDVVAVAMSQIGYQESDSASDLDGIGSGSNNYTEYNENIKGVNWLGTTFYWCASFVSWSLLQSGATDHNSSDDMVRNHRGESEYIWREVACGTWAYQLDLFDYFEYSKYHGGTYTPQTGDLIFFHWSGSSDMSDADHIGIVVYTDGEYVYTVEGNTSDSEGMEDNGDGVYFKKYSLGYSCIVGYGVLPYAANPDVPKIDYSGANPTCGLYMANSSKDVHASADSDTVIAEMPRYTMFEVTEIASNGRLKATYTDSDGDTVTGYILNNSYRVIQITATESNLDDVIAQAQKARYFDYSEAALAELRAAYDEALAVQAGGSDIEQEKAAANKLKNALANTADKEMITSLGADYTATANTRDDGWADDASRLTDGVKGNADGDSGFSGWGGTDVEVVVDLGEDATSNTFRVYGSANSGWGISTASGLTVYSSDDNESWTQVGYTATIVNGATDGDWTAYTMTVSSADNTSRYIKFVIAKGELTHLWIEEVEAAYKGENASGRVYISGFNTRITSGQTVIFTSDFGTVTVGDANHAFTENLIATWDETEECYIVESVSTGIGNDTPDIELGEGRILICAHSWEGSDIDDSVKGSAANAELVKNASVGDKLYFTQVDIDNKLIGAAPVVTIGEYIAPEPDPNRENLALNKKYTADGIYTDESGAVTYPDESGITLTDGVIAPSNAGYDHTAYVGFNRGTDFYETNGYVAITVDLEQEYWMDKFVLSAASDYHIESGIGAPEQITVLVSADGAEWTEVKTVTPDNDASVSCNDFVIKSDNSVLGRYIQFRIVGTRNWIMVSEIAAYEGAAGEVTPPDTEYITGDVDGSGEVDSIDYLMVKRYCFSSYAMSDDELIRADVDGNGEVDSLDYVFVKRIAFGSYIVK